MQFPSQNSRFLCNRPDGPFKSSGRPTMSRSFSVEDVRTSGQHSPDSRSSFSNFYLELDFMFRHGSGNSNRWDGRATPSKRFSSFQEDFCTRLSVFIITLCSSIGLRGNWCRWKDKKNSYNLNVWNNRNIRKANLPDGKRVASGRPPELRCF
jgi:hypothetical protein